MRQSVREALNLKFHRNILTSSGTAGVCFGKSIPGIYAGREPGLRVCERLCVYVASQKAWVCGFTQPLKISQGFFPSISETQNRRNALKNYRVNSGQLLTPALVCTFLLQTWGRWPSVAIPVLRKHPLLIVVISKTWTATLLLIVTTHWHSHADRLPCLWSLRLGLWVTVVTRKGTLGPISSWWCDCSTPPISIVLKG